MESVSWFFLDGVLLCVYFPFLTHYGCDPTPYSGRKKSFNVTYIREVTMDHLRKKHRPSMKSQKDKGILLKTTIPNKKAVLCSDQHGELNHYSGPSYSECKEVILKK